jgi:hypothetical protein
MAVDADRFEGDLCEHIRGGLVMSDVVMLLIVAASIALCALAVHGLDRRISR